MMTKTKNSDLKSAIAAEPPRMPKGPHHVKYHAASVFLGSPTTVYNVRRNYFLGFTLVTIRGTPTPSTICRSQVQVMLGIY